MIRDLMDACELVLFALWFYVLFLVLPGAIEFLFG